jgi:hypothetical protein
MAVPRSNAETARRSRRQEDRRQQEGGLDGGHDRDRVPAAVAEAASDQRAGQGALSRDVRIRHDGVKRLQHPEVGELELTHRSVNLPVSQRALSARS